MRKNGIRNTYFQLTYKCTSVGVAAPPNEYNLIEHNRLSDFSISRFKFWIQTTDR